MDTPLVASPSKLAEALAKAQLEIKAPLKSRIVDFTDKNGRRVKYSYADLADVIDCIRGPLGRNGLSLVHQLEYQDNQFGMLTSLLHMSGERLSAWYPLPDPSAQQMKPQEFGSALTYARRYSLSCLIGIASEEDDDGAVAAAPEPTKRLPQQNKVAAAVTEKGVGACALCGTALRLTKDGNAYNCPNWKDRSKGEHTYSKIGQQAPAPQVIPNEEPDLPLSFTNDSDVPF